MSKEILRKFLEEIDYSGVLGCLKNGVISLDKENGHKVVKIYEYSKETFTVYKLNEALEIFGSEILEAIKKYKGSVFGLPKRLTEKYEFLFE
jgi:hypothetical protein